MLIGGLQKMSLIDYPGYVSATVFTVGCNFRCHFCHNPKLVLSSLVSQSVILHPDEVINFLQARKNLLNGVCLTGGEPTLHDDLPAFIKKIKQLGYNVKLDTNGTNPQMLKKLIQEKLIDYVAMDIKAPWAKYEKVVNSQIDLEKIRKSVTMLMTGKISYEFRSTILPRLHQLSDLFEMAKQIKGARAYFWQKFRPSKELIDSDFLTERSFTDAQLQRVQDKIKKWFEVFEIR